MHAPDLDLEPLGPEHADQMFAGLADPAAYRLIPRDPPGSVAALRSRYDTLAAGRSPDGTECWLNWVIRRRDDAVLLGCTQATIRGSCALIAYQVFPAHWRRGVGTAAVRAMLGRLFALPTIDRARALIDTRNRASIAIVEKLGFERFRTIEHADFFKGSRSDEHEFVLSRKRWRGSVTIS